MIKRKIIFLFLLLIGLIAGCSQTIDTVPVELNNSMVGETYQMRSDFINTKTVTLYYPDTSSDNLLRIVKEINIIQNGSEVLVIAKRLLNTILTEEDNYIVPFNGEVDVGRIFVSKNLAIVNLEGDFTLYTEQEFYCGMVSIVNTLCELNSIEYVEILLNGKQMINRGLLVNPMSTMDNSLHLGYLDHKDIIENEDRRITRDKNILYFLDKDSNYLIADISNVTVSKESAAENLFQLLKNQPYYGSGIQSCIPTNVLISTEPVITEEDENKVLTIRLESPKYETMDNKTRYMMCGGITLTLLSYYDNVNAVRILLNGQPALEENLLTKEMFIENIGQIVTVFLPNRELDYLVKINFAMSQNRYNNPEERVLEIVLAEADYKSNTARIIPENVTESDIRSVYVHDLCCVVSISEQMYHKLIALPYNNRKMFAYSIVNTLTEFENINSVQFLVEGTIYENLGEKLYIETPLMNNPGIVFD